MVTKTSQKVPINYNYHIYHVYFNTMRTTWNKPRLSIYFQFILSYEWCDHIFFERTPHPRQQFIPLTKTRDVVDVTLAAFEIRGDFLTQRSVFLEILKPIHFDPKDASSWLTSKNFNCWQNPFQMYCTFLPLHTFRQERLSYSLQSCRSGRVSS